MSRLSSAQRIGGPEKPVRAETFCFSRAWLAALYAGEAIGWFESVCGIVAVGGM